MRTEDPKSSAANIEALQRSLNPQSIFGTEMPSVDQSEDDANSPGGAGSPSDPDSPSDPHSPFGPVRPNDRFLRLPAVIEMTGLSRATIYRMEKAGAFPRRFQLGPNSVGWRLSKLQEFMESREEVGG